MVNVKKKLRILFMGTPEFAIPSLKALIENKYHIVGILTSPDKPAGRGLSIQKPAVKKFAETLHIPVFQPEKLKNFKLVKELKKLKADLFVVVAFRYLPDVIWSIPSMGTINLHASLLPDYRGAAPINWAIINGEKETGVTTFFINHSIDSGNIILQEKIKIREKETAGELHDRLKEIGAGLLIKTIDAIRENNYPEIPQQDIQINKKPRVAYKLFREKCRIEWEVKTRKAFNFIRGLSPYPGAWIELKNKEGKIIILKIFKGQIDNKKEKGISKRKAKPGKIITDHDTILKIATSDGFIKILSLQSEGKKRMSVQEFLRGFRNIEEYKIQKPKKG